MAKETALSHEPGRLFPVGKIVHHGGAKHWIVKFYLLLGALKTKRDTCTVLEEWLLNSHHTMVV